MPSKMTEKGTCRSSKAVGSPVPAGETGEQGAGEEQGSRQLCLRVPYCATYSKVLLPWPAAAAPHTQLG